MSFAGINFTILHRERQASRLVVLAAAFALLLAPTFGAHAQEALLSGASGTTFVQKQETPATVSSDRSISERGNEPDSTQASQPEARLDLPHNLSPWGMFRAADWVVKAVMTGLAIASLATWTVWVAKTIEIACARARVRRSLATIMSSADLDSAAHSLAGRGGPAAFMVRSAEEEMHRSHAALDHAGDTGVKERLASRLSRIEAQAGRRLSKGTGVLATIGSTAPFVGLFGTVWGIMNAFIGISESQTTNLAVVAPGIAEALLATAIGLVAAIPAVVIYNIFARAVTGYRQLLADAAAGVEQLVSLGLDFRKVPATHETPPYRVARK
ncbi:tonB-system energizer ExbB [Agrobacterium tumefaciens]|uniref:tonB-system energizer ExbB n=1 Tax=Agrobacterium tumefaciens TaxID=358 RepID=UPI0021CFF0E0|nr:tonB-system energizer ExbB [Agrobacterium tumefaciens]UXS01845.1 tonB-system energizer ExbB [Agrobacterium tumefaciens]